MAFQDHEEIKACQEIPVSLVIQASTDSLAS